MGKKMKDHPPEFIQKYKNEDDIKKEWARYQARKRKRK